VSNSQREQFLLMITPGTLSATPVVPHKNRSSCRRADMWCNCWAPLLCAAEEATHSAE
jgi:hypothetical protein